MDIRLCHTVGDKKTLILQHQFFIYSLATIKVLNTNLSSQLSMLQIQKQNSDSLIYDGFATSQKQYVKNGHRKSGQ